MPGRIVKIDLAKKLAGHLVLGGRYLRKRIATLVLASGVECTTAPTEYTGYIGSEPRRQCVPLFVGYRWRGE